MNWEDLQVGDYVSLELLYTKTIYYAKVINMTSVDIKFKFSSTPDWVKRRMMENCLIGMTGR
jgi:hypothetical protein